MCKVRVNLVLSIEKLGDARRSVGDDAAANSLYEEGKTAASAAPGGCFTVGAEGNSHGEGDRLSKAKDGLTSKAAAPTTEDSQGSSQTAPANLESQKQLEQLEQSGREAQQERVRGQQRKDFLDNSGTPPTVDRPW